MLLNVILTCADLMRGATVVTPSSVVFCQCHEGRSQLAGKDLQALLLQKLMLQLNGSSS